MVIQKSIREGFGLVVAEALWKGTPVVASRVGDIPLQVINGVTGFLHDYHVLDGFTRSVVKLPRDEKLRKGDGKVR